MSATHILLGSTVCLKDGSSPDLTLIESNRDGTVKLALFDGKHDHYLDVAPDAIELRASPLSASESSRIACRVSPSDAAPRRSTEAVTPLELILRCDPDEPRLTGAQERQRAFFCAQRDMFHLGRAGVETFTAISDEPITDQEFYSPANNSTIRDIWRASDRAAMLWKCVIRDARAGHA